MERLSCPTCGNEVFFDSMRCVRCETKLTYSLNRQGRLVPGDVAVTGACSHRDEWRCNWTPDATTGGACPSCRIVDAGDHGSSPLLVPFLTAQRRALWQLAELDIPGLRVGSLRLVYRSRTAGDRVSIGHLSGLITLDLDEADPARGEEIRSTLGEHYRTPLGHLRHELGHYVWLRHIAGDPERLAAFRATFGDETVDYQTALDAHYAGADDGSWRADHVSYYASAHPWEDFAESWAQVMHIHDVVSTGVAWGVIPPPDTAPDRPTYDPRTFDPAAWVSAAVTASLAANELARAMGMRDLYPFALSVGARRRIEASWQLVHRTLPAG